MPTIRNGMGLFSRNKFWGRNNHNASYSTKLVSFCLFRDYNEKHMFFHDEF